MLLPVREELQKPHFVRIHKHPETLEFREPYRICGVQSPRREMSHSEKNEPTEMAANTGLIANNLVQRIEGWGQAGGAIGIRTEDTAV